jgi:hypothetical protein
VLLQKSAPTYTLPSPHSGEAIERRGEGHTFFTYTQALPLYSWDRLGKNLRFLEKACPVHCCILLARHCNPNNRQQKTKNRQETPKKRPDGGLHSAKNGMGCANSAKAGIKNLLD